MTDIPDHFAGIAFARPEDEDAVYAHLLELHRENGLFTISEHKVRNFIRLATEQKGGLIGIIRGETDMEGSAGAIIESTWYSDDLHLSERWVFVHPDYRRQNHASRLVDFLKWCDGQLNLPLLAGIMSTNRTEAKERLYQRKLTRLGGFFGHSSTGPIVTGEVEVKTDTPVVHLDDLRKAGRKVAANV